MNAYGARTNHHKTGLDCVNKDNQIITEILSVKMLRIQRNYGRQVLHSTLYSDPKSVLPSHESQECFTNPFVTLFSDKGSYFLADSFILPAPSDLPKFDFFKTVSDETIHNSIMKSPTKFCLLDPWTTFLLKEC